MTALAPRPVFLDVGGTRARRLRRTGIVLGSAALAYIVMLVVGIVGPPGSPFGFRLFGPGQATSPAVQSLSTGDPRASAAIVRIERGSPGWGRPAKAFVAVSTPGPWDPAAPQTAGRRGTAGGQLGTPAGQAKTPPGQAKTPLGQAKTPPGQTKTPPGQTKTPPGQAKTPAAQAKTPAAQAKTPPGQTKTPPGQAKTPPGQAKTPGGGGKSAQHSPRH